MKILLYGLNYAPELTGIGKYSGELGSWLAKQGHEVKVVSAPPYYPDWEIQEPYKNRYFFEGLDTADVSRCPLYVPKKPTALKRILHLLSFSLSSAPLVLKNIGWKPDVVINVVPTLFSFPGALLVSRLSGSKLILHIQDYEVDAMLGLNMAGGRFIGKIARWYERLAISRADLVTTISASMMDKAIAKGATRDKLKIFPNWSDLARFIEVSNADIESLRERLDLPVGQKICLYAGNIGEKQGLENVLEAAMQLTDEPVQFIFVGQGSGVDQLKARSAELALDNVRFYPLQPLRDLPALLSLADCHLIVQKKGVADAVMPSKLTNILAVGGQALITAESGTELAQLCESHQGIAEVVGPENVATLVEGIRVVLQKPCFNEIAQSFAKKYLDKEAVLIDFEQQLL